MLAKDVLPHPGSVVADEQSVDGLRDLDVLPRLQEYLRKRGTAAVPFSTGRRTLLCISPISRVSRTTRSVLPGPMNPC